MHDRHMIKNLGLMVVAIVVFGLLFTLGVLVGNYIGKGKNMTTPQPTTNDIASPSVVFSPLPEDDVNISVSEPVSGQQVSNIIAIRGQARVFENVVNIRLSDSSGKVLVSTTAEAMSPDVGQFGPFEKVLSIPQGAKDGLVLEAYQASAKDGSDIDKVTIPLVVK